MRIMDIPRDTANLLARLYDCIRTFCFPIGNFVSGSTRSSNRALLPTILPWRMRRSFLIPRERHIITSTEEAFFSIIFI